MICLTNSRRGGIVSRRDPLKHRSVEKSIQSIIVRDDLVYGEMAIRIVSGGKNPQTHVVLIDTHVDFDHTERDKFGELIDGAPRVTWTIDAALDALFGQLNAKATEVARALETVRVA